MSSERPLRRMTLRQLLIHAEKTARDIIEVVQTHYQQRVTDFRDLSRPVRRRSHYPKLLAVQNALRKLMETAEQTRSMNDLLYENLDLIREHANRERVNRM
jgi:hypothetical protein